MIGRRTRIGFFLALFMFLPAAVAAQQATPVDDAGAEVFTVVEHADFVTTIDVGDPGTSPGDLTVWGPDPLFDEANEVDTGALTHGSCTSLNTEGDNHCIETVLFPDGSTLEIQGIQRGSGEPSLTTIVGGSGVYRDASGTLLVDPSDDFTLWTKTFTVYLP